MNSIFPNTGWFKQFFARSEKLLCCIGYAAKVINVFLKSKHCNKRFYWTDFSSLGVLGRSRAPFTVDFLVNVWKRRAVGFLIFRVCRKGKGEEWWRGCAGAVSLGGKWSVCREACPLAAGKRGISPFDRSAGERKVWHVLVSTWELEVPLYRLFGESLLVLMKSGRVCAKNGGLFGKSRVLFSATARVFER